MPNACISNSGKKSEADVFNSLPLCVSDPSAFQVTQYKAEGTMAEDWPSCHSQVGDYVLCYTLRVLISKSSNYCHLPNDTIEFQEEKSILIAWN